MWCHPETGDCQRRISDDSELVLSGNLTRDNLFEAATVSVSELSDSDVVTSVEEYTSETETEATIKGFSVTRVSRTTEHAEGK